MGQSPSKPGSVNLHLSNALEYGSNTVVFSATKNATLTIDESFGNALSFSMNPQNTTLPYIDGITLAKNTICILFFKGTAGTFDNTIVREYTIVSGNDTPVANKMDDIIKLLPINGDGNDKSKVYTYNLSKINIKTKVEGFGLCNTRDENETVFYIILMLVIVFVCLRLT